MNCNTPLISITNNQLLCDMYSSLSSCQNTMNCMFALFPYVIVALLGLKKCCVYFFYFLYLGDADGELIARLCGQSAPSVPLVIAAPQVWVHFVSDENTEDKGFWAHYTFEGKWLDRLLPWLTEALLGNVASHLVIWRMVMMGSTLKEVLKSYTMLATIYILLKQACASS